MGDNLNAGFLNRVKKIPQRFVYFVIVVSTLACTKSKLQDDRGAVEKLALQSASFKIPPCAAEFRKLTALDVGFVELNYENLDRGRYLATHALLVIEKKSLNKPSRVIIKEWIGGKSPEIVCSDSLDLDNLNNGNEANSNDEIFISAPVKIEIDDAQLVNQKLTFESLERQFFFYRNHLGMGVHSSNVKPISRLHASLVQRLSGRIFHMLRTGERNIIVRASKENEEMKAQIYISFDHFKK